MLVCVQLHPFSSSLTYIYRERKYLFPQSYPYSLLAADFKEEWVLAEDMSHST